MKEKKKRKKLEVKNINGKTFIEAGLYSTQEGAKKRGSKFEGHRVFKKSTPKRKEYFELFVHFSALKTPTQLKLKKGKSKFI